MRWRPGSPGIRTRVALAAVVLCCVLATCAMNVLQTAANAVSASPVTRITIDGLRHGREFDGIGAISGGGGNARLLIDYPPKQRTQILNYLFGRGGADLQILKLEIGGDAAPSDGADPSVEHARGEVDCTSGYDWWLAEQAVARDPAIRLIGLQWSAPGWIGTSIWARNDIDYLIDWLGCARSHGLSIGYLGGWDEHGFKISWFEELRKALDASGYGSVKLMAADSFPGRTYDWAKTWRVAKAAASDPAFKSALAVIAAHDTCGGPTRGYSCQSTPAARRLGLPLWESELGTLHGASSAPSMARTINNGYIQAGITGFLEWPLAGAMPPGLLYDDRGIVVANEPQSGFYSVNKIAWAIAQTTQFVQPGWWHVAGASGDLGATGTYDAYVAPNRHDWSLVAENAGNRIGQRVKPQTITVRLAGGLRTSSIGVWATDLGSADPARWFVRYRDVHVSRGAFSFTIPANYVVSFTSTTGQARFRYPVPPSAPMGLPYAAAPDQSNEAWGLATQEGAFIYRPCLDGVTGSCIQQLADQPPIWWQKPMLGIPEPYAIVGATSWSDYTVAARVLVPTAGDFAYLVGRFSDQSGNAPAAFNGYELQFRGDGRWHLLVSAAASRHRLVLASGTAAGVTPDTWQTISLGLHGSQISATINGKLVATKTSTAYSAGLAGIESDWAPVQFQGLTVG